MTELIENPSLAGALQEQRILARTTPKPPAHILTVFYSETCPYCNIVIPQIEDYVKKHPEIMLLKVNAATDEGTNRLEATLKGFREVPTVLVDDRFVIKGDEAFLPRLTYALRTAKTLPPTQEETQKWLLRK